MISLFLYLHLNLKQHCCSMKFVKVWLHFIVMAEFADQ